MADNAVNVVTGHQSWSARLGNSLKGICFGIVLLFGGVALLSWNEYNSVQEHWSLREGMKIVISPASSDSVDNTNNDKLVHLTGRAMNPSSNITDLTFGVTASDTLKLKRDVEMYQWVEHEHTKTTKNTGGSSTTTTTYSYDQEWENHWVDSQQFHYSTEHANPALFPYPAYTWAAPTMKMGAFTLSKDVIKKISWYEPLNNRLSLDSLPSDIRYNRSVQLYQETGFYLGKDPGNPAIGDIRVTFSVVVSQQISIVAKQTGGTFAPYLTSNDRRILLIEQGVVSAEVMFADAQRNVRLLTWLLRLLGFGTIWLALQLVVEPISVVFDVLPFVGNVIEGISCAITGVLAGAISSVIIALAWFAVRPILSVAVLTVVGGLIFYAARRRRAQYHGIPTAPSEVIYAEAMAVPVDEEDVKFK